jgi:EmrB/QacA subfamily drug resistance transporter
MADRTPTRAVAAGGMVLLVLASGQFLMTLDSSVMNVSIRQVAADVGTTVVGIQTAITLYTLVMASLMITGGKIGAIIGRRRAFAVGLVIYGVGSATTSVAPNLGVLLLGWSLLEGIGAALIMPAIVALVAGNVAKEGRPRAYGMIAAAGAIAVAVGPLIGGAVTTYASWRWVFVGEVVVVLVILAFVRKIADVPPTAPVRIDVVGALLSIVGMAALVYGVLRSGEWGWVRPRPGAPTFLGTSPVLWLVTGGLAVLLAFVAWSAHRERRGAEPLIHSRMFRNRQLNGGLIMFSFQFFVQAGVFFTIPLYLSVVLELSAVQTGIRLLPLSGALLLAALLVPKVFPVARPRRVVRVGFALMSVGILVLIGGISPVADAGIVTIPLLLLGLGIGCLASQLGAVTVSAVPDSDSAEVGGLQNTMTNLGASLGTALVGAVLISSLTASLIHGINTNEAIPEQFRATATVELESGVPFVSDSDAAKQLQAAGVPDEVSTQVLAENSSARLDALRGALWVAALLSVLALFFTGLVPDVAVGRRQDDGAPGP